METIKFRVTSTYALLMHNAIGMKAPSGQSKKPTTTRIPLPEEEAAASAYCLPSGQLYAPATWFRSSLINGGRNRQVTNPSGKGRKVAANKLLAQIVFDNQEFCPLVYPKTKKPIMTYEIDSRRAVVQGAGIIRSRAKIPEWQTEVEFQFEDEMVDSEVLLNVFQNAGAHIGVGDFRPFCPKGIGGPFGRYKVELLK